MDHLSLGIDDGALSKNAKLLLDIDGGSLATEVERGRGHCHKIEHSDRVRSAMAELRPLRKQLSQMLTIYSMQTQFVDATGAI